MSDTGPQRSGDSPLAGKLLDVVLKQAEAVSGINAETRMIQEQIAGLVGSVDACKNASVRKAAELKNAELRCQACIFKQRFAEESQAQHWVMRALSKIPGGFTLAAAIAAAVVATLATAYVILTYWKPGNV